MGGCIQPSVPKKAKIHKQPTPINTNQKESLNTTLTNIGQTHRKNQPNNPPQTLKPKFKKTTGEQFTRLYRIQDNIETTSRVQGPKYICNYADGIGKVLRVIPLVELNPNISSSIKNFDLEKRVKIYEENLGLQIFQDQQHNLLVLQDYYCGPYIYQLWNKQIHSEQNFEGIRKFLSEVYQIIQSFHQKNTILGNLTIFSFRHTSTFDPTVRLIDLNFFSTFDEGMGHAFKAEKAMDWQFFAFLVQSSISQGCPIFIPHKLQYVQNSNNTVHTLLRGKKIKRQQLDKLVYGPVNPALILGYKFRSDLNRLIRLRRRRNHHRDIYYAQDVIVNGQKLNDEAIQRFQVNRIHQRIQKYIENLTNACEQPFLMYNTYNESLNKLKTVFVGIQGNKKIQQFKQVLTLIK